MTRRPKRVAVDDLVGYDDILERTSGITRDYLRAMKRRGVIVAVKDTPPVFAWSEIEETLRAVEAKLRKDGPGAMVDEGAGGSS